MSCRSGAGRVVLLAAREDDAQVGRSLMLSQPRMREISRLRAIEFDGHGSAARAPISFSFIRE